MPVPNSPYPPLVRQLTFMAGNSPRTPFREIVEGAAKAGFDSITLWPNIWRHALRKEGLSLKDMRALLDDNGLSLTDGDACRDWVPAPSAESGSLGPIRGIIGRAEYFDVMSALGGTTIVAVHMTDAPLDMDRDTETFARLCDDAAPYGLRVGLEFVGFTNIKDVATAWRIVSSADRPNGGLVIDIAHHVRAGRDDNALKAVPADRIYTVQLCDGPEQSPFSLLEEALYHRQWPGTGDFDVPGFLRTLNEMGVRASVGPELYEADFEHRPLPDLMRDLKACVDRVLQAADLLPGAG